MRRRKTNRRDCKFVLEENNSFPSQGKDIVSFILKIYQFTQLVVVVNLLPSNLYR